MTRLKNIIQEEIKKVLSNKTSSKQKLVEGVQYNETEDSFIFDFAHDSDHDIIKLTNHGLCKSSIYNKCFLFKYQFDDSVESHLRAKFIDYIKFHDDMDEGDIATFVENAVNSLDDTINLREYNTVVYPQSISEINRKVISYIRLFGYPEFASFELVKEVPKKLEFDYDSYTREVLDATHRVGDRYLPKYTDKQKEEILVKIENMMQALRGKDYFSIGRDMKYKYRKYLRNFYKFENKEVEKAFTNLEKPKVLVIDDVMTSGATLSYIVNTIFRINPEVTITIFTLIGKK